MQNLHLFRYQKMTGYELRLWRKGMNWSSDRAAEELGVSLRTWKVYEKSEKVSRVVELATFLRTPENHQRKDNYHDADSNRSSWTHREALSTSPALIRRLSINRA